MSKIRYACHHANSTAGISATCYEECDKMLAEEGAISMIIGASANETAQS